MLINIFYFYIYILTETLENVVMKSWKVNAGKINAFLIILNNCKTVKYYFVMRRNK